MYFIKVLKIKDFRVEDYYYQGLLFKNKAGGERQHTIILCTKQILVQNRELGGAPIVHR